MSTVLEEPSPPLAAPGPMAASEDRTARTELAIRGMTCASCVARIERKLGKIDGVQVASVNLATEHATVDYDPARIAVPDLVRTIEAAGYTAQPLTTPTTTTNTARVGLAQQELAISGMTCASCVARIERKLGKLEGVRTAGVNLATER